MFPRSSRLAAFVACLLGLSALPSGQGSVKSFTKISNASGGLYRPRLRDSDQFGRGVACIGDLNDDGVVDLVVGAHGSDDGAEDAGSAWVVFLNADGTVQDSQKISATSGGFTGTLDAGDGFGRAVAGIGDFDGDGVEDIAVGANRDDDGGLDKGAVWLLFLNTDGTVKDHRKISATSGGFGGQLRKGDEFGRGMTLLSDMDGDGVDELAVCATADDDGGPNRGAVWVLFMNADATVKTYQKISYATGGFTAPLQDYDSFGMSIDDLGDFDGDGVEDLLIGSIGDDAGGSQSGAVYVVLLNPDATVKSWTKVNARTGGLAGLLDSVDQFGFSVARLGDLDGDGVTDVAVGAILDDDGGNDKATNHGCAWILMLNPDGTVRTYQKISQTQGNFPGQLDRGDWFGSGMCSPGDLDGDGLPDLCVGSRFDDDAGNARGAVYVFFLDDTPPEPPVAAFSVEGFDEGEPVTGGAPLDLELTDLSTGSLGRWVWTWNDGTVPSTFQNNLKTYVYPGTYLVKLDVTGPAGTDQALLPVTVTDPEARFVASTTQGLAPLSVPFFNQSSSLLTELAWDFGDGRTSTQENPIHVFRYPGVYTVTLSAAGGVWADEEVKVDYVHVLSVPAPVADFDATPLTGDAPLEVAFTDLSTGTVDGWSWDFGDGSTSTDQNPVHTYGAPGTFTVALTASNPEASDVLVRTDLVQAAVPAVPVAAFTAAPTVGAVPLQVQFTDASLGILDAWSWDFGDGATSTEESPSHVYASLGTYTVGLSVSGPGGESSDVQVGLVHVFPEPPPVAAFTASPTTGVAPLQVAFADASTGTIDAWSWDFGDGGTSTEESPSHVYAAPGTYSVSLGVSGPFGTDEHVEAGLVVVLEPPPVADFSASPTSGETPVDVSFTDLSLGNVTSWHWDFGDGGTSSLSSPRHVYEAGGTYTVTLTVGSDGGVDSLGRPDLLQLVDPPPPGIFDGGFEDDVAGAPPGGPWTVFGGGAHRVAPTALDPAFDGLDATPGVDYGRPIDRQPDPVPADGGFPVQGRKWCELSAEGTFDAPRPSKTSGLSSPGAGAGIRQSFRYEEGRSQLSLHVAFLLDGVPGSGGSSDWMSVEISDGSRTKVVWFADASSPLDATSAKYGLPMTDVVHLAGDVANLFPSSTVHTDLVLTVQVGNGGDGERPSRGYVDHVELLPSTASAISCDGNPPGSLVTTSGGSTVGGILVQGIDNPLGTQAPGSLPVLAVAVRDLDSAACGLPLAGWSMYGDRPGRLLVSPGDIVARLQAPPWCGPGAPSPVVLEVPADPSLVGLKLFLQGLLFDPSGSPVRFGLTEGVSLVLTAPGD